MQDLIEKGWLLLKVSLINWIGLSSVIIFVFFDQIYFWDALDRFNNKFVEISKIWLVIAKIQTTYFSYVLIFLAATGVINKISHQLFEKKIRTWLIYMSF